MAEIPNMALNVPQNAFQSDSAMPQQMPTNDAVMNMAMTELAMNEKADQMQQMAAQATPKITAEVITKALNTLKKYKDGKVRLEKKLQADEEYWKKKQWKYISDEAHPQDSRFEPATPWLFSCIQSRYSDVMDSYPTCNIQPRQMDDKGEAKILSQIIPVIMDQCDYEETYSKVAWYMLKHGGSVQAVLWDGNKHNGLGDISIKAMDFMNMYWEPGITDIQDSPNVFTTELMDNELLEAKYPQCKGKLGGQNFAQAKYIYDENIDCTDKSYVIDWYYKKPVNGKITLQYCKFVNDIVLYATEDDNEIPMVEEMDPVTGLMVKRPLGEPMATRGLYDHAKYPFVVQDLFPIEGGLCGYGLIDIGRDTQTEIDLINRAITENAIAAAKPRYFVRADGSVSETEFADMNNELIHCQGSLGEDAIRLVDCKQLSGVYTEALQEKIQELKYCTSCQDVNNGVASSGVTAASAIASLQEAAGKNARSANMTFHRAYKEVVYFVVELIRQFYDTPRTFRIVPDALQGEQYVNYSNANIRPQQQMINGMDMGYRVPEFDIEVTTEKADPYKKMEINELALSFYGNGFFNPQMSDQALATLQMMDFRQKDEVMQRVSQNGTIYQAMVQYMQLALQLAQRTGDENLCNAMSQDIMAKCGQTLPAGFSMPTEISGETGEHPYVERAREQARQSTQAN